MLSEISISPSEAQGVGRKEETKVGGVSPMLSPGHGPSCYNQDLTAGQANSTR